MPAPQPAQAVAPGATTEMPPSALTTWISPRDWARAHHLDAPKRVAEVPVAEYSVRSDTGTMVLAIGSREATWNGVDVAPGFAPQMIDGEICLYGLDLQKSLQPLLCEPPMTFAPHRVIVLDPGHGGSDSGTHSVLDGRFEKEFTLDLAKRLKPLLEAEGWTVYLTRTSDVDLSHSNRVIFADAHSAGVFISLHFNSSAPDTTQAGLETYCMTPTGMPSTMTRNYADPWNERVPNNAFDAQNLRLAVRVHSALLHSMGMNDRGIRHTRFITVLRGQMRPAILIEAGYLSNPHEASLIENEAYRQRLAEALAAALEPQESGEDRK